MNKLYYAFLLFVMTCLSSCGTYFNYVQVFDIATKNAERTETALKATENHRNLFYEDNECAIHYAFWSNAGSVSFRFYNKTDKIICIDLTKSFFIKNGIAIDYYNGLIWSDAHTQSNTFYKNIAIPLTTFRPDESALTLTGGVSRSIIESTSSSYAVAKTTTVTYTEPTTVAIPPKASKIISSFPIQTDLLLDCDLERYPAEQATLEFSEDNSPLRFSNYITYNYGEGTPNVSIENDFYISAVTNYAKPAITEFVKRPDTCPNIDDKKPPYTIYDLFTTLDTSNRFYLTYRVLSRRKLYQHKTDIYIYKPEYNGYIRYQL